MADATTTTESSEQTQTQQSEPASRPDGLPEAFWDTDAGSVRLDDFVKSYNELSAVKRANDERAAAVPDAPDKYELGLPDDFQLPDGIQFEFQTDTELAGDFRALAHELKLTPQESQKLVALYARELLRQDQAAAAHREAERQKLGERASARIEAVETMLKGHLSATQFEALGSLLTSADAIAGIEVLFQKLGGPKLAPVQSTSAPSTNRAELEKLQASPEYLRGDPETHRRVREGFLKLHGNKAYQQGDLQRSRGA